MWTFLPAPHSPLTYLLYVVHTQQNICSVSPSWCFHIMCNGRGILLMYLKIPNHLPVHHPSCVPICLATCLQHCLFVCPVFPSANSARRGHHPRLLLLILSSIQYISALIQHPVSASALGFPSSILTERCGQYGPSGLRQPMCPNGEAWFDSSGGHGEVQNHVGPDNPDWNSTGGCLIPPCPGCSGAPVASPAPPAPLSREPHIPALAFLIQCSLVFAQQPLTCASDQSRIAYTMGHLKRKALEWASAIWDSCMSTS